MLVAFASVLFIHPMWDSEVERIGKARCTPVGSALHAIGEFLGCISGVVLLLGLLVGLWISFPWWWVVLPALAVAVVGRGLHSLSWWFARRKSFAYDSEAMRATWRDGGEERSFTQADWIRADDAPGDSCP